MSAIFVLILRFLLAISLYAFLFLAIFRMWKDFEKQSHAALENRPQISFLLLNDKENSTAFNQNEISIGRDIDNDLSIDDEAVSSQHARIKYENGNWLLEDLNSTNGTFLNDMRIYTPTVLVHGDEIILGNRSLVVEITD